MECLIDCNLFLIITITLISLIALICSFKKMEKGFGPFNLRIVGIILIPTFAPLISIIHKDAVSACMGLLGAVAGYLFGIKKDKSE